jgi:hypothetical protein
MVTNHCALLRGTPTLEASTHTDSINTWQIFIDTTLVAHGPCPSLCDTLRVERLRGGKTLTVIYRTDNFDGNGVKIQVFAVDSSRYVQIGSQAIERIGTPVFFDLRELLQMVGPKDHLFFEAEFHLSYDQYFSIRFLEVY